MVMALYLVAIVHCIYLDLWPMKMNTTITPVVELLLPSIDLGALGTTDAISKTIVIMKHAMKQ